MVFVDGILIPLKFTMEGTDFNSFVLRTAFMVFVIATKIPQDPKIYAMVFSSFINL